MRIRAKFVVIGLVALTATYSFFSPSAVRADELLRWKFAVGEKLDYTLIQDTNTTLTSVLGSQQLNFHQEMDMTWDVQGVDEKTGEAVIRQKFERIKIKTVLPQGTVEFDSKSEVPP